MHGTSAGVPVTLSSYGGLVTLAKPETVPEGASPRTYDTDYDVGSVGTRAGLTNVYTMAGSGVGPNPPTAAASSTWANPDNILVEDGSFTTQTPVNITNFIDLTVFAFGVPGTSSVDGVLLTGTGFSDAPCDMTAQLLIAGVPTGNIKTISLPSSSAPFTLGSLLDSWGLPLIPANVNATNFGIRLSASSVGFDLATVFLDFATLTLGVNTGSSNFQFITPFVAQNGDVKNFSLDADGNFYVEDVTNNPGVLTLALEGITPNSLAVGINGEDVEYLAFSDGLKGSDMPLQWTQNWIDRITQVGPGAAPTFTPLQNTTTVYDVASITQPVPGPFNTGYVFGFGLWSGGPGSTSPGNVVTIYYADATTTSGDPALIAAFSSGNPVYVYLQMMVPVGPLNPETVLLTSIGIGTPPGQARPFYYFTYTVPSVDFAYSQGNVSPFFRVQYQQSLATMTTTTPVPGLEVGDKITITGSTPAGWNAQWTITQTPNSGEYAITSSQVVSGLATFGYAFTGGTTVPPAAGQLVTITGTTNDGGALNLANATIVTGGIGATGTFTVNVSSPDATAVAEDGLATTAGTVFTFDPGAAVVGTTGNPIFGNSTTGSFTWGANAQFIANGTRQGTVFFITRNGYFTMPATPVTFTTPENTTSIGISNIPIGPPNVVARGIAITEAGQLGVPGSNFFYIPTQVQEIVNDVIQTSSAFLINDNTSTSANLAFSDSVLLSSTNIGVYGYNLFNQIEIGDPAWVASYADRNAYGLCWNKIQNFNNLSFDGGYNPGTRLVPLGWTINDVYREFSRWLLNSEMRGTSKITLDLASHQQGAFRREHIRHPCHCLRELLQARQSSMRTQRIL